MKKLSKPHLLKMTKKDLARVLTIIREKENA
jgi:ribosomal protein L29